MITLLILVWIKKRAKGAFKYYVSAGGGVGLSQNADTADAGEGGGGVSDKMLTLLTLGSGGVKMLGLNK